MAGEKQNISVDPMAVLKKTGEQRNQLHDQLAVSGVYIEMLEAENASLKAQLARRRPKAAKTA